MEEEKINLKNKSNLLDLFLVSFIVLIILIIIGLGFVWYYRIQIFDYFAKEYYKDTQNSLTTDGIQNRQSVFTQESFVIEAVKKADPAVVSIVVSKDVPKYESYTPTPQNSPWSDLFPNFFFNFPQYRQNGTEKKDVGGGTGFFISADGLIVTNKHVVDQKDADYTVLTNDGKKHSAKVIARDAVLDVALLKIEGISYSYLTLGNSDNLAVGQSVIAIGNALAEFRNTVSVGIISGLARSITAGDSSGKEEFLDQVIQTDTAINPGNSGGPLLDLSGQVIGVNVAIAQGSQNIAFALPINSIKGVIQSVKETGKIIRPYLGVRYININSEVKEKNNLTVDYGVIVRRGQKDSELAVIPGSPANKAGLVENDVILEIDGVKLDAKTSLTNIIRQKSVGAKITLKILHKGEEKNIEVTLEAAKD